jgi:hypothetical protein
VALEAADDDRLIPFVDAFRSSTAAAIERIVAACPAPAGWRSLGWLQSCGAADRRLQQPQTERAPSPYRSGSPAWSVGSPGASDANGIDASMETLIRQSVRK